jgi:four helix bundle protein
MSEASNALRLRLHKFAVRTLRLVRTLPRTPDGYTAAGQLARAGTGASFNYRSACRGRSRPEFAAKIGVAADEADEAENWLLVIRDSEMPAGPDLNPMLREAGELRAILWASYCTARDNLERDRSAEKQTVRGDSSNRTPRKARTQS